MSFGLWICMSLQREFIIITHYSSPFWRVLIPAMSVWPCRLKGCLYFHLVIDVRLECVSAFLLAHRGKWGGVRKDAGAYRSAFYNQPYKRPTPSFLFSGAGVWLWHWWFLVWFISCYASVYKYHGEQLRFGFIFVSKRSDLYIEVFIILFFFYHLPGPKADFAFCFEWEDPCRIFLFLQRGHAAPY